MRSQGCQRRASVLKSSSVSCFHALVRSSRGEHDSTIGSFESGPGVPGSKGGALSYRWLQGGVGNRGFPVASWSGQTTTFAPFCHWTKRPLLAVWYPRSSTA
jgi:hypothetical protein